MNQLIKLLDLVKAVAECYKSANADGKITWVDIYKFEPCMDELADFIKSTTELSSISNFDPRKIAEIGKKIQEISKAFGGK